MELPAYFSPEFHRRWKAHNRLVRDLLIDVKNEADPQSLGIRSMLLHQSEQQLFYELLDAYPNFDPAPYAAREVF